VRPYYPAVGLLVEIFEVANNAINLVSFLPPRKGGGSSGWPHWTPASHPWFIEAISNERLSQDPIDGLRMELM